MDVLSAELARREQQLAAQNRRMKELESESFADIKFGSPPKGLQQRELKLCQRENATIAKLNKLKEAK